MSTRKPAVPETPKNDPALCQSWSDYGGQCQLFRRHYGAHLWPVRAEAPQPDSPPAEPLVDLKGMWAEPDSQAPGDPPRPSALSLLLEEWNRHIPDKFYDTHCGHCGDEWPCQSSKLVAILREAKGALEEYVSSGQFAPWIAC